MSIALLKNVLFPAERKRPQTPVPAVNADSQIAFASASSMHFINSSCETQFGVFDFMT